MAINSIALTSILARRIHVVLILPTSPGCLIETIIHFWSALLGSSSFDILLDYTFESANAHPTLSMSRQCVVSSERVAAETWIRLGPSMDLRMALQVMATNEALLAVIASKLPISQVCLNMGFDVLFPAKLLAALFVSAHVLAINRIGPFDELCNIVDGDIGILD